MDHEEIAGHGADVWRDAEALEAGPHQIRGRAHRATHEAIRLPRRHEHPCEPQRMIHGLPRGGFVNPLVLPALEIGPRQLASVQIREGISKRGSVEFKVQGLGPAMDLRLIPENRETADAIAEQRVGGLERAIIRAGRQHQMPVRGLRARSEIAHPSVVIRIHRLPRRGGSGSARKSNGSCPVALRKSSPMLGAPAMDSSR